MIHAGVYYVLSRKTVSVPNHLCVLSYNDLNAKPSCFFFALISTWMHRIFNRLLWKIWQLPVGIIILSLALSIVLQSLQSLQCYFWPFSMLSTCLVHSWLISKYFTIWFPLCVRFFQQIQFSVWSSLSERTLQTGQDLRHCYSLFALQSPKHACRITALKR